jgi:class 3 adenylate cyclase/tetratricopeptide (TPR) repeat protein
MLICSNCGQENPDIARFCLACATPLGAAPAARAERKIVTVLFADLVGFTSRAELLDPEAVRAFIAPYHARLRSELERFGGTVEKFIGDAIMAIFGAPIAHEDDPERAVRAALAIRDWVRTDAELQVRIGVNTGEALVALAARPEAGEGMALGDVVNTAERLESTAPINGILVSERTYRATSEAMEYREVAPVLVKGKAEPLKVWEPLALRSDAGRLGVHGTPLVGRRRELNSLQAALSTIRAQRALRLVTLTAGAGVGKSRLLHEFRERAADVNWRQGRCVPYGAGVTFWALGQIIKTQAGILEADSAANVAEKLRTAVGEVLRDDPDAEWVESHLRPLVGLASRNGTREDRRSEAFFAWRRFLEAVAQVRPLVLVVEDLHWADGDLLDFIEHLLEWATDVPLLLVCTARPELLERRPGWGANRPNSSMLALSALPDQDVAQIVSALLGSGALSAETRTALLEQAAGNPLYAQQYTRLFLERGRVDEEQPATLQGLIAARLDALTAAEKDLLQAAAVIGKVFWTGSLTAVAAVDRWSIEERLRLLERKELVGRSRTSSIAGDSQWVFGHILIRDVAYSQIPRVERAEKHRIVAEWIESLGRPDDHAEMVAHHYVSAHELDPTKPFAVGARLALRRAGDRAFALNAFAAAARLYERALELWPADDRERPQLELHRGRALYRGNGTGAEAFVAARDGLLAAGDSAAAAEAEIILAELASYVGEYDRASKHLDRALDLIEPEPDSWTKAFVLSHAARLNLLRARLDAAIALGHQALEMAGALDLDDIRVHSLNTIGTARVERDEPAGLEDVEQSLKLARRINSPESARGYLNLAVLTAMTGDLSRSFSVYSEGLHEAERLGVGVWHRFLRSHSAQYAYWGGRWGDADKFAEGFVAEIEAGSPHYEENQNRNVRALMQLARDDVDGALADTEKSLARAREIKDAQNLCPTLAIRAFVLLSTGQLEAAKRLAAEMVETWERVEQVVLSWGGAGAVAAIATLDNVDQLDALENNRAQRSLWVAAAIEYLGRNLERAAQIYARIGSLPDEAYARLRAAEQFAEEGHPTRADAHREVALRFYRSVGAMRYVREAEALGAARW